MKAKVTTLWQDKVSYVDPLGRHTTDKVRIIRSDTGVHVQVYRNHGKSGSHWTWGASDGLIIATFKQAYLEKSS